MFRILTVKDTVRVGPEKLGKDLKEALMESISEKYVGISDKTIGIVLAVVDIKEIGEGKVKPTDPGIHFETVFELLTYKPELHELVEGEVIDNTDFGAFVNIGPFDGLVHISQIMDDYVSYDKKTSTFIGKQTRKTLKIGDKVRARITSVSWGEQVRIGLTMRQAGLGNFVWIEEEKKKKRK